MWEGAIYKHLTSKSPAPKLGDLEVWWIPQVPGKAFRWRVKSLAEASNLLDCLAAYDDFQHAENVKGDYANVGGLLVYSENGWVDWHSKDGEEFDEWREHQTDIGLASALQSS